MSQGNAQSRTFRGFARNTSWHEERIEQPWFAREQRNFLTSYLLAFRVERVDNAGNVIGYVSVEFRLWKIKNVLVDGDEVEVVGRMGEDGILSAQKVRNLMTKAVVNTNLNFISTGPDRSFWGNGLAVNVRWEPEMPQEQKGWFKKGNRKQCVLSFHLKQIDDSGKFFGQIPVEFRNEPENLKLPEAPARLLVSPNSTFVYKLLYPEYQIETVVQDGDEVEVYGKLLLDGTVAASRVLNRRTRRLLF